ncbi:MAG: hypothetical protein H0W88_09215 [Parachlamydiaceae bacterium]|nr:hypothetical protein [Parachlamydiaceae bacterium]
MTVLISQKKAAKPPVSNSQKTFNRLKKKVDSLQKEIEALNKELDANLQYYQVYIHPHEKALNEVRKEFIKLAHSYYREERFTPKERQSLKDLLMDNLNQILGFEVYCDIDDDIKSIFKDLNGKSLDEFAKEDLEVSKKAIQDLLKEGGIDIDLSTLDLNDDFDSIRQKMSEAMYAKESDLEDKPKNKKELQKEIKAQNLEELQKKGLNTIYKKLAKAFHPDLEMNPEQKASKEILMKKLTCAYENEDLHTLLALEMEWLNMCTLDKKNIEQSDDQLKIYNSILKEQVEELEIIHMRTPLNPKYMIVQRYLDDSYVSDLFQLKMAREEIRSDIIGLQEVVKELQGKGALKMIRTIIKQCS